MPTTSVMDICERTSLLPGSCVCLGHPAAIGVSPVVPATDNTSPSPSEPLWDSARKRLQQGRLQENGSVHIEAASRAVQSSRAASWHEEPELDFSYPVG